MALPQQLALTLMVALNLLAGCSEPIDDARAQPSLETGGTPQAESNKSAPPAQPSTPAATGNETVAQDKSEPLVWRSIHSFRGSLSGAFQMEQSFTAPAGTVQVGFSLLVGMPQPCVGVVVVTLTGPPGFYRDSWDGCETMGTGLWPFDWTGDGGPGNYTLSYAVSGANVPVRLRVRALVEEAATETASLENETLAWTSLHEVSARVTGSAVIQQTVTIPTGYTTAQAGYPGFLPCVGVGSIVISGPQGPFYESARACWQYGMAGTGRGSLTFPADPGAYTFTYVLEGSDFDIRSGLWVS